jgi:hypothetical protein
MKKKTKKSRKKIKKKRKRKKKKKITKRFTVNLHRETLKSFNLLLINTISLWHILWVLKKLVSVHPGSPWQMVHGQSVLLKQQ